MRPGNYPSMLTPIRPASETSQERWLYACACGSETSARRWDVNTGRVKSCGCLRRGGGAKVRGAVDRFVREALEDISLAEARIDREVSAGKRCRRCWLLGHNAADCDLGDMGAEIIRSRRDRL